uniref:Uncharacterized protein n=1 Tax=Heterorhabditis bacteriophora TaxID=37862 RepID=A0A1I7WPM7_HETBA
MPILIKTITHTDLPNSSSWNAAGLPREPRGRRLLPLMRPLHASSSKDESSRALPSRSCARRSRVETAGTDRDSMPSTSLEGPKCDELRHKKRRKTC